MSLKKLILLAGCAVLLCPALAAAQFPSWQVPAGGETWTAGSSHTLCWSGGTAQVFGLGAYDANTNAFYPIGSMFPNTGNVVWNIPANLPPGTYYLTIGFNLLVPPTANSGTFTIRAAPECLVGCNLVSANLTTANPWTGAIPLTYCGMSQAQAWAYAEAAALAQLEAQCSEGYSIDAGSVQYDTTGMPQGSCHVGYFGGFMAESFAFGCCCPDAVPAEQQSWGSLKTLYR